jgi:hypothetical protein
MAPAYINKIARLRPLTPVNGSIIMMASAQVELMLRKDNLHPESTDPSLFRAAKCRPQDNDAELTSKSVFH